MEEKDQTFPRCLLKQRLKPICPPTCKLREFLLNLLEKNQNQNNMMSIKEKSWIVPLLAYYRSY